MRAIILCVVFLTSFYQKGNAQELIENGTLETIKVDLKHARGGDPQHNEMNRIMGSIAYAHQKPVETIRVSWELISSYQIVREEKGNFISEIFIKPYTPQGDIDLYEINSAKYIIPALQSFRLRIFKEDSSLVYLKIFNKNPVSVSSVGQIAHFSFPHQRWSKGWYLKIDQFEFQPDKADYTFEQWFQYTNDYKAANYLVASLLNQYQELQLLIQEPSTFLIKSLRQANYLKELYQQPFYYAIVAKEIDPDNLKEKMTILATLYDLNIEKYIPLFKESVSTSELSVENLVSAYLQEEENLLVLQKDYGSIYDNLFQQLTKTNYPINLSHKKFNFFDSIGADSADRERYIAAFENKLYSKSIVNIDDLILNHQFAESLYSIDNLERFVASSKYLKLNDVFNQYKARSAYGMYYSYIEVIDKAIKIRNTNLAIQYIKKAGIVQETYPNLILTNNLVEKKLRLLLDDCYSDFNHLLQQNQYAQMAAKRDTIREIINYFQMKGVENMLSKLEVIDDQALK